MEKIFDNKINILKAFAIALVVAGHLGISLIPLFPTYSFHMALFFFISGYLFKQEHLSNIKLFIKKKAKSLLVPYFWYSVLYFIISFAIYKRSGIFPGSAINLKNYLILPFVNSGQIALMIPLWFITQLFISLITFTILYKILTKLWNNKFFHLIFFLILAITSVLVSAKYNNTSFGLIMIRTFFSMFFIYFGFFYKQFIKERANIFSVKWIGALIIIQAILWNFNIDREFVGLTKGLEYILAEGEFNLGLISIITSVIGIWISLFFVEIFYPYLKDNKFVHLMGKNTYHILANHTFIIYCLSSIFLWWNKYSQYVYKHGIFFVYAPEKTSWLYFVIALVVSLYIGVLINYLVKRKTELYHTILNFARKK